MARRFCDYWNRWSSIPPAWPWNLIAASSSRTIGPAHRWPPARGWRSCNSSAAASEADLQVCAGPPGPAGRRGLSAAGLECCPTRARVTSRAISRQTLLRAAAAPDDLRHWLPWRFARESLALPVQPPKQPERRCLTERCPWWRWLRQAAVLPESILGSRLPSSGLPVGLALRLI